MMVDLALSHMLFPNSAFVNINHLGLSDKSRYTAKRNYVDSLLGTFAILGIQELHYSPARSQDLFLNHFHNHCVLYNTSDNVPGQCIMIEKRFLHKRGIDTRAFDSELEPVVDALLIIALGWCLRW